MDIKSEQAEFKARMLRYIRVQLWVRSKRLDTNYYITTVFDAMQWHIRCKYGKTIGRLELIDHKEAEKLIKEEVPKFIRNSWGSYGRINKVYDSSWEIQ